MARTLAGMCVVALTWLAPALPAQAVCLDPKSLVSGYHLALGDEVRSTDTIVVGKVTKSVPISEDREDPDAWTAYIYTVQVIERLKGVVPATIQLKVANDSGRYPMEVGETHLLFLTKGVVYFEVDGCGNSSALPKGNATLAKMRAMLSAQGHAP